MDLSLAAGLTDLSIKTYRLRPAFSMWYRYLRCCNRTGLTRNAKSFWNTFYAPYQGWGLNEYELKKWSIFISVRFSIDALRPAGSIFWQTGDDELYTDGLPADLIDSLNNLFQ